MKKFDFFLSHSSKNKELAKYLYNLSHLNGINICPFIVEFDSEI